MDRKIITETSIYLLKKIDHLFNKEKENIRKDNYNKDIFLQFYSAILNSVLSLVGFITLYKVYTPYQNLVTCHDQNGRLFLHQEKPFDFNIHKYLAIPALPPAKVTHSKKSS